MSWLFMLGQQSIRASASVLPMNIQGWSPLGLTPLGLISVQSKGLSRVFPSTTIRKQQFFSAQLSLWFNSHICTWLLEKNMALTIWTFVIQVKHFKNDKPNKMYLKFRIFPCGAPPSSLCYFPYFYGPCCFSRLEHWAVQFHFIQSRGISIFQTPQFFSHSAPTLLW